MISPGFPLLKLPNVSSDKLIYRPVTIDGSLIRVGISHSSISTLSLRPPRVENAFSVAPGTVITAVSAGQDDDVAYTTVERNKHFLRLVSGPHKALASEAASLFLAGNLLTVIYKDLTVEAFDPSSLESVWTSEISGSKQSRLRGKSASVVLFTALIDDASILVVTSDSKGFNVQIVAADIDGLKPLKSTHIATSDVGSFSYSEGILYRITSKDKTIYLYGLPDATLQASFQIEGSELLHVLALTNRNILIQQESKVTLIDCAYQSKISEQSIPDLKSLLAYVPDSNSVVAFTGDQIIGMTVNSSSGSLLESIGHGVTSGTNADEYQYGYVDIFNNFTGSVKDYKQIAKAQIESSQLEVRAILSDLEAALAGKDATVFLKVIAYLRSSTAWKDTTPAQDNESFIFDDSDRDVDRGLIEKLVYIVFNVSSKGVGALPSFIPTNVPIYLLTHPLFPTGEPELANIFNALEAYPLLYRQAVVTLPGINAKDLLRSLLSPSDDIFGDAVTRLNEEFSQAQILSTIQEVFSDSRQANNLIKLVKRLTTRADAWTLVAPLVDAIGLLSWDKELIAKLQQRLVKQVEYVEGLNEVDVILTEVLRSANLDVANDGTVSGLNDHKWKSKKQLKVKDETVQVPLYSIETLTFN